MSEKFSSGTIKNNKQTNKSNNYVDLSDLYVILSDINASSVTYGWFWSILFQHPWVHLVTSLVFNQICMTSVTFSYPMKLRVMHACWSSVSGSPSKFCSDEIWLVYMVHAYFNVNKRMYHRWIMGWRESLRTQTHGLRWYSKLNMVTLYKAFVYHVCSFVQICCTDDVLYIEKKLLF